MFELFYICKSTNYMFSLSNVAPSTELCCFGANWCRYVALHTWLGISNIVVKRYTHNNNFIFCLRGLKLRTFIKHGTIYQYFSNMLQSTPHTQIHVTSAWTSIQINMKQYKLVGFCMAARRVSWVILRWNSDYIKFDLRFTTTSVPVYRGSMFPYIVN